MAAAWACVGSTRRNNAAGSTGGGVRDGTGGGGVGGGVGGVGGGGGRMRPGRIAGGERNGGCSPCLGCLVSTSSMSMRPASASTSSMMGIAEHLQRIGCPG